MNEEYMHPDCNLIYVDENIPGPYEGSVEYDNIVSNFNSRLNKYCKCESICTLDSCKCLWVSGGANYETYNEEKRHRLNFFKNSGNDSTYPVIECNSLCTCSELCGNRVVQNGPINGLIVKNCTNMSKGKGLFTTYAIPKGIFVCEYAGEVITLKQAKARHEINAKNGKMNYIFCLNEYSNETHLQTIVDPSELGNLGRYINHSCQPNCAIIPVRVDSPIPKLAIFSQIDIPSCSEITYDYGSNTFSSTEEVENRKTCLCGSENCRGFMPSEKY